MLRLQTTGIKVKVEFGKDSIVGWVAECNWYTLEKHCQSGNMEGTISTRYFESTLKEAIECVLELIDRFNIEKMEPFALYRDEDILQTQDVLQIIREEAKKRNWECCF